MPARLRDLARALAHFGIETSPPDSGSHWLAKKDGRVYPLAAHNGPRSELADVYIRGVCRCFGIDEKALRKHL